MSQNTELKEERIRKIAQSYYSRKDILKAIYNFSKHREVSPRYFEGFGKRPDSFQYPSDILSLVKRGATSFHCSEELWEEPLEISTELSEQELNDLRTGWDLVFDIDCKWIDYSKKAAIAILKALEYRGVTNCWVKFSGSKGFHIVVPWEAFPEEVNGIKTKDMFPEWPRAIVGYVTELSRPILQEMLKNTESEFAKEKGFTGIKCENCNNLAQENFEITLECRKHSPYIENFRTADPNYKKKKCPICKAPLTEKEKKKFYSCPDCNLDSINNPENFNEGIIATDIFKILGLDLQLVSSRHLFRMPYSLHEKNSLASIVIPKEYLEKFELIDANPLNVEVFDFIPTPKKNEAEDLLIQAIDWQKTREIEKENTSIIYTSKKPQGKKDFKPIKIPKLSEDIYPPTIKNILKGMADGKKRGLFILLNFFRSLGQELEEIEKILTDWNKKNQPPLKKGYIDAQLQWHAKNKIVLPPNFNNPIYKELGVLELDPLSQKTKNPVNYAVIKSNVLKKKK